MKLLKHQQELLDSQPDKILLSWGTGTGKTIASLALAKAKKGAGKILVVCPKGLKRNWERNCLAVLGEWDWGVLSKEEFKRVAKELYPYTVVIIDESHYFHGITSGFYKALLGYFKRHKTAVRILCTATPYRSTPLNVLALRNLLGKSDSYPKFKSRFFSNVWMGSRQVPLARQDDESRAELQRLIREVASVVALEECADVPEQTHEVEYFALSKEQKKAIMQAFDPLPIVRFTREHQICGGTLKGDGYVQDAVFDCAKRDRVVELAEQNNRLIVVCRYNHEIVALKEALVASGYDAGGIFVLNGRTTDRDAVLTEARKVGRTGTVLLVNAECSEGWEYPECGLMVFYSYSFSLVSYVQMIGRILRINALKKNTYLSLVVEDSIDEDVYKSIQAKKDFQVELYQK